MDVFLHWGIRAFGHVHACLVESVGPQPCLLPLKPMTRAAVWPTCVHGASSLRSLVLLAKQPRSMRTGP